MRMESFRTQPSKYSSQIERKSVQLKFISEDFVEVFKQADLNHSPVMKTQWKDHFHKVVMEYYKAKEGESSVNVEE